VGNKEIRQAGVALVRYSRSLLAAVSQCPISCDFIKKRNSGATKITSIILLIILILTKDI
jgi:hypothetical protein